MKKGLFYSGVILVIFLFLYLFLQIKDIGQPPNQAQDSVSSEDWIYLPVFGDKNIHPVSNGVQINVNDIKMNPYDELFCSSTDLLFNTENEIVTVKIERKYLNILNIKYLSQNRKKVLKFETLRHPNLMRNIVIEIFFDGLEGKEIKIISFWDRTYD